MCIFWKCGFFDVDLFWSSILEHFGCIWRCFGESGRHFGSQSGAKRGPKGTQNEVQNEVWKWKGNLTKMLLSLEPQQQFRNLIWKGTGSALVSEAVMLILILLFVLVCVVSYYETKPWLLILVLIVILILVLFVIFVLVLHTTHTTHTVLSDCLFKISHRIIS